MGPPLSGTPIKLDPIKCDPIKWDPIKWDPIKWDPIKWDLIKWDLIKWDPGPAAPGSNHHPRSQLTMHNQGSLTPCPRAGDTPGQHPTPQTSNRTQYFTHTHTHTYTHISRSKVTLSRSTRHQFKTRLKTRSNLTHKLGHHFRNTTRKALREKTLFKSYVVTITYVRRNKYLRTTYQILTSDVPIHCGLKCPAYYCTC